MKFLALILSLLPLASLGQGVKISAYPNTATLSSNNLFIIAIPGVTNKNISYGQLSNILFQAFNASASPQVWKTNAIDGSITNVNTGFPVWVQSSFAVGSNYLNYPPGNYLVNIGNTTFGGSDGFNVLLEQTSDSTFTNDAYMTLSCSAPQGVGSTFSSFYQSAGDLAHSMNFGVNLSTTLGNSYINLNRDGTEVFRMENDGGFSKIRGVSYSYPLTNALPGQAWTGNGATPNQISFTPQTFDSGSVQFPTNAIAIWPTAASTRGGCAFVNSNATVYLITSAPNSTAWAATNKIAGP